jgi:hypothetical protein
MRKGPPAAARTATPANPDSNNQPSRYGTTASAKVPAKPVTAQDGWFSDALKNASQRKGGL